MSGTPGVSVLNVPLIGHSGAPIICSGGTPPIPPPQTLAMPAQALLLYGGSPQSAITNVTTLAGLPFANTAPNYNIVMLNNYLGVETTAGATWPSVIPGWKASAAANGLKLNFFFYTNGMGPVYNTADTTYKWLAQALTNASMWAYTSLSGSGTTDILEYSGSGTSNAWLQITPYNIQAMPAGTINGKTNVLEGANLWALYNTYFTDVLINGLATSKYGESASNVANTGVDGIYFDNVPPNLHSPSSNNTIDANWLGFSNPLQGWNATADAQVQLGQNKLIDALASIDAGLLNIGNGASAVQGTASNPNPGSDNEIYHNPGWDFFHAQYVFGYSYSMETYNNSPPGQFMQWLSYATNALDTSGMLIMEAGGFPAGEAGVIGSAQSGWSATNWSGFRMMLSAAIMGGYVFAADAPASNPADALLWDEMYQAAGTNSASYNWLGAAIDPPQTAAWQSFTNSLSVSVGVWRRRFVNGTVFWVPRQANGSGNLDTQNTITVTGAGTGLSYCANTTIPGASQAYSDTAVNTGLPISSANGGTVTLINDGYGAGLILCATPV